MCPQHARRNTMAPNNIEALEYVGITLGRQIRAADYLWLERLEKEPRYHGLDLDYQLRCFADWWSDRPRQPKSVKRAFRNWLAKAIEFGRRDGTLEDEPTIGELVAGR